MSYLADVAEDRDLTALVNYVRRFEGIQSKHGDHGACDTEPDGEWHRILREAGHGRPYPGTATAYEWQLFSTMRGVGEVAAALTGSAKAAHRKILAWFDAGAAPHQWETKAGRRWRKIAAFLRDYCWRVGWH